MADTHFEKKLKVTSAKTFTLPLCRGYSTLRLPYSSSSTIDLLILVAAEVTWYWTIGFGSGGSNPSNAGTVQLQTWCLLQPCTLLYVCYNASSPSKHQAHHYVGCRSQIHRRHCQTVCSLWSVQGGKCLGYCKGRPAGLSSYFLGIPSKPSGYESGRATSRRVDRVQQWGTAAQSRQDEEVSILQWPADSRKHQAHFRRVWIQGSLRGPGLFHIDWNEIRATYICVAMSMEQAAVPVVARQGLCRCLWYVL